MRTQLDLVAGTDPVSIIPDAASVNSGENNMKFS